MGGLASPGDNDRGTRSGTIWSRRHGGGEMHQRRDAAEHTLCVIHQANQLPQVSTSTQIHNTFQGRMVMANFADLDEQYFPAKMINHALVTAPVPPFDRVVKFSAGIDDPKRNVLAAQLMNG